MGLYENIRDIAKTKGVSINRLEKELGFARSSINKFNKNTPSVEKLQQIAEYLNVTVDYLVSGEENVEKEKYYLNDETAKAAQEIFENKDLRVLFDAARDASPEDLKTTYNMLMALKRKERDFLGRTSQHPFDHDRRTARRLSLLRRASGCQNALS